MIKTSIRAATSMLALAIALPAAAQEIDDTDDAIIVTATRSGSSLENLPVSVSVVDEEDLTEQLRQNRNILSALEFTVPGLSNQPPESRSSCGSQIRGRNASFQINGVPVNEDLRPGSCTAPFAITPFAIERVEVVRGGTALYGAGSPGGIINLITRRASGTDLEIDAIAQTSFNTEVSRNTFTTDLFVGAGQSLDTLDYYVGAAYTDGGISRSAAGRPTLDNAYEAVDLIGSFGLQLGEGELRFTGTFHDEDKGIEFYPDGTLVPETAFPNVTQVAQHPQVDEAGDRSITAALSFTHPDMLAHAISLSLFLQDQKVIQRDNFFSDAFGNDFFASNRANSRVGLRSTLVRSYDVGGASLKTSYGMDLTRNDFFRFNVDAVGDDTITGYVTPDFYLNTLAPFAQLELVTGPVTVTGGVRHEWYSGAITPKGYDPALPRAATPGDFANSELTLWNLGATLAVTDENQIYAGFSQGAELSQLGRAARGATDPGEISNEPATSDQYELGLRGQTGPLRYGLVAYYTESDSSSQIQPDPSCAGETFCPLIPLRVPERTWGLEAEAHLSPLKTLDLSAILTLQRGEVFDGTDWISFSTDRSVPLRLTGRADWTPMTGLGVGLQVSHYGSSSYFTATEEAIGLVDTDAVTLVGMDISYDLGPVTLYAAADNLLDQAYVTPASQATGAGFSDYEAPGRRVTIGISGRF